MKTPAEVPGAAWPRHLARVLALLLAVQLGAIGGLLLLRPGRRRAAPPAAPSATAPSAASPTGDKGAAKGAPAPAGAALLVDVLDGGGAPQRGVAVLAQPVDERGRPASAPEGLVPLGELGVLKGRLPLTTEVIAGGAVARELVGAAALRATTDERGTARLSGLPAGRLQVMCSHLGQTASVEVVVPPGAAAQAAVHLVLRLGSAPAALLGPEAGPAPAGPEEAQGPVLGAVRDLQGLVLDERGLGLARARVEAQGSEGHRTPGAAGAIRRAATSDASGHFTLVAVPPGPVTILVQHPGFAPLTVTPDEDALRGPLRLQLQPGAGVEGVVRERRLGGLPDRLQLTLHSGALRLPVPVGRDGRFLLTGLPPGEATLRAEAPGYVPLARRVQLGAAEHPDTVTLRDLVLDMELGGTLSGQLRDGRGPAARAQVRALDERGAEVGRAQTDAEGRFRIGALPSGRLQIEGRSAAGQAAEGVEVRPGDETRIDLELRE